MNLIKHKRCEDVGFLISKIKLTENKDAILTGSWIYLRTKRPLVDDVITIKQEDIKHWNKYE